MMSSAIPAGTRVGIDSNVLIGHFLGRNEAATDLLERVATGEIAGVTTAEMLLETAHRLMVWEARAEGLIRGNNPARRLRRKPEIVAGLHRYYEDVQTVKALGIEVLAPLKDPVGTSQRFRREYGLLVNDSLLAATLVANGVETLVTADRDFLRVKELQVCLLE